MERRKQSIDMLSGLPDEVLCHILSFLRTKLSVRTSVLAKRWRFVWKHVPNLEFHGYHSIDSSKTRDLDIIIRVIMLHEAKTVNTFNLSLSNVKKGCAYLLETLIIYPINRGIRSLFLEFDEFDVVCTLPRLLFTSKTLVDLKLDFSGVIPSTGEMFLPSLKKLNLSNVVYESDQSLPHLLSGCPVLEELVVQVFFRERQNNSGCVIVSSPTIKKMIVDFSQLDDLELPVEMLIIDVPTLVYLKVFNCILERVKSLRKAMTSLIEVEITLNEVWHNCGTDCTEHGRSIEFLSCLSHVMYLKIQSDFNKTILHLVGIGSTPKFVNLTKLKLDLTVYWFDLVKFLKVADNLEVLIISLHGMPSYKEPERAPPCMLSRLRNVRMLCFSADEDGFAMVKYILRNAQVLERMEIDPVKHIFSDKDKFIDVLRRISLFERGSKSCQLAFNTH